MRSRVVWPRNQYAATAKMRTKIAKVPAYQAASRRRTEWIMLLRSPPVTPRCASRPSPPSEMPSPTIDGIGRHDIARAAPRVNQRHGTIGVDLLAQPVDVHL